MIKTVFVLLCLMITTIAGQSLKNCIPKHCACKVNNTTSIPPQAFNVDSVDWRPVVLATALGLVSSCLVLTTMGVWWKWKTGSVSDVSSLTDNSGQLGLRSASPSTSSNDSWAGPRNKFPPGSHNWHERSDSGASNDSTSKSQSGKRVWPGQFEYQ